MAVCVRIALVALGVFGAAGAEAATLNFAFRFKNPSANHLPGVFAGEVLGLVITTDPSQTSAARFIVEGPDGPIDFAGGGGDTLLAQKNAFTIENGRITHAVFEAERDGFWVYAFMNERKPFEVGLSRRPNVLAGPTTLTPLTEAPPPAPPPIPLPAAAPLLLTGLAVLLLRRRRSSAPA